MRSPHSSLDLINAIKAVELEVPSVPAQPRHAGGTACCPALGCTSAPGAEAQPPERLRKAGEHEHTALPGIIPSPPHHKRAAPLVLPRCRRAGAGRCLRCWRLWCLRDYRFLLSHCTQYKKKKHFRRTLWAKHFGEHLWHRAGSRQPRWPAHPSLTSPMAEGARLPRATRAALPAPAGEDWEHAQPSTAAHRTHRG